MENRDFLPLRAVIASSRKEVQQQFEDMYKYFWEILFIAEDNLTFWAKSQQFKTDEKDGIDLICASSDVVNVSHEDREPNFIAFIQQIQATYPEALIHILLNKNETFEELLAEGNIQFHQWNKVDDPPMVMNRLQSQFKIKKKELVNFRRYRMQLEQNTIVGQTTMDFKVETVAPNRRDKEEITLIKQQDTSNVEEDPILKGQLSMFDTVPNTETEKEGEPSPKEEVPTDTIPNTEPDNVDPQVNEPVDNIEEGIEEGRNKEESNTDDGNHASTSRIPENQTQTHTEEAKDDQDRNQVVQPQQPESPPMIRIQDVTSPFDLNPLTRDHIKRVVESGVQTRPNYFQMKASQSKMVSPKVVAVVNLYDRCGASFIANNFALYLASQNLPVGVLELPQSIPMLYKRLGGDSERPRNWESWFASVKNNNLQYKAADGKTFTVPCVKEGLWWKQHQVYWIPINPHSQIEDITDLAYSQLLSAYITAMDIPILLVDISSNLKSWFSKIIYEYADEVWITVEPEWERIQYYGEHIEFLRNHAGDKLHYICNKSVSTNRTRSDWQKFTKRFKEWIPERPLTTIPLQLELRDMEDNHAFAFLGEAGEDILSPLFEPLMQRIAPINKREQARNNPFFSPKKWLKFIR